jgi:hypothetical protein
VGSTSAFSILSGGFQANAMSLEGQLRKFRRYGRATSAIRPSAANSGHSLGAGEFPVSGHSDWRSTPPELLLPPGMKRALRQDDTHKTLWVACPDSLSEIILTKPDPDPLGCDR